VLIRAGPLGGQAGARDYAYHARDIAHGLHLVASGRGYRKAAAYTRVVARRAASGITWGSSGGKRRRVLDGQLVAN
jgi:hypothetical protein